MNTYFKRLFTFLGLFVVAIGIGRGDDVEKLFRPTDGVPSAGEQVIFSNNNPAGVFSNPSRPTQFTIQRPCQITHIWTYHWNGGKGATPGTIAVRHSDGTLYGPWHASGKPGQRNVANAYWGVRPGVTIKPGTYSVVDSNPSTWSQNSSSGGAGICEVRGIYQATPPITHVLVPNVIGMNYQGASARLQSAGLRPVHGPGVPAPSALVSSQDPSPGTRVNKGSDVRLVLVSLTSVPNVIGLTHAQAHLQMEAAGLRLVHPGEPPATVVVRSQYPASGSRVQRGTSVSVTFQAGIFVPNLIGLRGDLARDRVEQLGLVFVGQGMDLADLASYRVIGQTPNAGTAVSVGTKVLLVGEKSEKYVIAPNLVGFDHASAHLKADSVGLVLLHEGEPADDVLVQSQEPRAGAKVQSGSSVYVVFREPPKLVEVPNLVGMSGDAALSALEAVGLRIGGDLGTASDLTSYKITAQTPAAGASVLARTIVDVKAALSKREFSYQGNVYLNGTAVTEYPAELRFLINRGQVTGRLYARPLCETQRRQFGAMITFTGAAAGPWEGATSTIIGTYAGEILGCDFGSGQPRTGLFTIFMKAGKVFMTTDSLYFNTYIFSPTGDVVQANATPRHLDPFLSAISLLLQGVSQPVEPRWQERQFGEVRFQVPGSWVQDEPARMHEQTWYQGSKEKKEVVAQFIWRDEFTSITDRMASVETKKVKRGKGEVTIYTGLSRAEIPQRGTLIVFDGVEAEKRTFALFAYCRAEDWLTHQPTIDKVRESIRFDSPMLARTPRGTIAFVDTIPSFDYPFRYFAYSEGSYLTDRKTTQQSHVGIGAKAVAADIVFQPYLAAHPEERDQLGPARSQMRPILKDRLKVQVFEAGALVQEVSSGKVWASLGEKRTPAPPRVGQLAVFPYVSMTRDDYALIACADRVIVRNLASNEEQTVRVSNRAEPTTEKMLATTSKNSTFLKYAGVAISPEAELFNGSMRLQIFEGGIAIYEPESDRSWQLWHAKRKAAIE